MTPKTEMLVRLAFFTGVLLSMTLCELRSPRRLLTIRRLPRWSCNLGLVLLNTLAARLVIPVTAVSFAELAASGRWGLLHQVDWPAWLEIPIAVLLFDLTIYLQHVMFHAVPVFWRLHMVHHADLDFDATTGVRFHTLEILLSALIKLAAVVVIGPASVAVVIFEVLLNATAMFSHSNIRIPLLVDRWLRWFIVTPDMHRVHHSVIRSETNSNFGFNLPWWDFLLGTYRDQPSCGHEMMSLGVADIRDENRVDRLPGTLVLPFLRDAKLRASPQAGNDPRSSDKSPSRSANED